MKVVIDIPVIEYDKIIENDCELFNGRYFDMIRNGTPLRCVLDDCISRQAVLEPYQTLKDTDTICIWLLRKSIEQQPPVTESEDVE